MPKSSLIAGAAGSALLIAGFVFAAQAMPRPAAPGSSELRLLVQDEENAEVENLLEPESDQGSPMRSEGGYGQEGAYGEGEGKGESAEKALESTVGDDGVDAIQQESIPPE